MELTKKEEHWLKKNHNEDIYVSGKYIKTISRKIYVNLGATKSINDITCICDDPQEQFDARCLKHTNLMA